MNGNPEFQRNLWLEITAQRLIAMPAILGLWLLLLSLTVGNAAAQTDDVQTWFLVTFVAITLLWGSARATRSMLGEFTDRTWDQQRMSALSPWAMTWGKVFGSTIFAWYGGAICLAIYLLIPVWGGSSTTTTSPVMIAALLIATAVLFQAGSVFFVISSSRRGHLRSQLSRGEAWTPVVLLLMLAWPLGLNVGDSGLVDWYGTGFEPLPFALGSTIVFAGWAMLGTHRRMRTELQFVNGPWVWLGFVLFLMVYFSGFIGRSSDTAQSLSVARLVFCFALSIALVYLTAFAEPKDPTRARKLTAHWRQRRFRHLWREAPTWVATLCLAFLVLAVLVILPADGWPILQGWSKSLYVALFLFLLRDVGLLLGFNLSRNPRRADFAVLMYLLVLYTILPGIFHSLDLPVLTAFFWPWAAGGPVLGVLPVACQLVLIGWWIVLRWNRYEESLDGSRPRLTE